MRRVICLNRLWKLARRYAAAELTAYLLLAVLSTWPLARHLQTSLAMGTETSATVPLFTTWTVWWNADRVSSLYEHDWQYWDAPVFHPTHRVFAFSEPMPTTIVVAPVIWITGSRVLAHNVFLLLALALNGWSTFLLLRRLRLRWLASAVGGATVQLLPLVHSELGVLQLVPMCGIVWTIHALYLFGKRPTMARSLLLGMAFAFTYLTCAYYGLFLSVLLIVGAGWLLVGRLTINGAIEQQAGGTDCQSVLHSSQEDVKAADNRRGARVLPVRLAGGLLRITQKSLILFWRTWPALAVCVLLIGPVIWGQLRVIREHSFNRSPDLVSRLAAEPIQYLASPWPQMIEPASLRELRDQARFQLCPGFVKYALALLGACMGMAQKRYRYWTLFCLTVLAAAFVLSMGPKFQVATWTPYESLMHWYPGFAQARNVFRFAMFVQLMVALLAALGVHAIAGLSRSTASGSQQIWARCRRVVPFAIAGALGVSALVEILPPRQHLFALPPITTQLGWIDWLKTKTPDDCVIACVPFPRGKRARDYEETAVWMHWGTFHQRRMVNGYSGFFPKPFLALKKRMRVFPRTVSLRALQERGVDYCVVRRSLRSREIIMGNSYSGYHLVHVFADDEAEVDIYRLR